VFIQVKSRYDNCTERQYVFALQLITFAAYVIYGSCLATTPQAIDKNPCCSFILFKLSML